MFYLEGGIFDVTVMTVTYSMNGSPNIVVKSTGGIRNLGVEKFTINSLNTCWARFKLKKAPSLTTIKIFKANFLKGWLVLNVSSLCLTVLAFSWNCLIIIIQIVLLLYV